MKFLTLNEEIILLAIWKLNNNAYGVSIRDKMIEMTKKNVVYGTLYNSLDYLLKKGYVRTQKGDPTPERGGKSKVYYFITEEGIAALQNTRELHNSIWQDVGELEGRKGNYK